MDAVYVRVNTKGGAEIIKTSDRSMRRFIIGLGIYATIQTSVIIWFALQLG
jgi:hypothetical protein